MIRVDTREDAIRMIRLMSRNNIGEFTVYSALNGMGEKTKEEYDEKIASMLEAFLNQPNN